MFDQLQVSLFQYATLTAIVFVPFVIFALSIHFLERTIQVRLAERFGWGSVMWTGWLGTPIHELSHAVMCKLFRHKIVAISLFEPDLKNKRLGYVMHTWRKGNWFEEMGNVFIGIAPLIGGSLVLLILLRLFFPAVFLVDPVNVASSWEFTMAFLTNTLSILFSVDSIFSFKYWVFVYLVLCVTSHMAPSQSDYEGAMKGSLLIATGMIVVLIVLAIAIPNPESVQNATLHILTPLLAILAVAVLMCGLVTAIVSLIVGYFPKRYTLG